MTKERKVMDIKKNHNNHSEKTQISRNSINNKERRTLPLSHSKHTQINTKEEQKTSKNIQHQNFQ